MDDMADVEVRRARAEDLLRVLAVHAHRDPDGKAPDTATASQARNWEVMMGRDGLFVYLAEVGAEPVGTASVVLMPNVTYDGAPTAFIEAVVVDLRFRRRGIATVMLDRVLADAESAGCNKVQLLSHKRHADDGGHSLYRSLGFDAEAEGFRRYLRDPPAPARRFEP